MASFTWTAKHKKTGATGGRFFRHGDIDTLDAAKQHLLTHFPNVEVLDLKLVTEEQQPEPDGAKEHPDARPPATIDGRPVTVRPIPPEDFQTGAADAARREISQRSRGARQPE